MISDQKSDREFEHRRPVSSSIPEEVDYPGVAAVGPQSAVVIVNGDRQIVYCNPQIKPLSGYNATELLNRDFSDFLNISPGSNSQAHDRYSYPGMNRVEEQRATIVARDGRVIPIEISTQSINWHEQAARLFILREILDSAAAQSQPEQPVVPQVNVIAINPKGVIVYISESACRLNGWRCEEVLGRNISETIGPEFHHQISQIIQLVCSGNAWSGVVPVMHPNGNNPILINLKPVFDQQHNPVSIIGVFQDLNGSRSEIASLTPRAAVNWPSASNSRANQSVSDNPSWFPQSSGVPDLDEVQARFKAVSVQLDQLREALSRDQDLLLKMYSTLQSFQSETTPGLKIDVTPKKFRLEIFSLGILRVCSSTKQIQRWQSNRAKSVFEYLINKRSSPVSRDILMEALWPDYGTQAAANNLKTAIHDLRQNLAPLFDQPEYPAILLSHEGYLINPEIELIIDAEAFELLWNQGKQLEKAGRAANAINHFERAEALYLGDYLEDSLYEEWTVSRRETLKDIYLLIINKLADYSMSNADYENCITYCHKILEKDNCREDTYRMLMSSYSRLRQKNNALRWFDNCRQTLITELGSLPSQETISLFNRLKSDETI